MTRTSQCSSLPGNPGLPTPENTELPENVELPGTSSTSSMKWTGQCSPLPGNPGLPTPENTELPENVELPGTSYMVSSLIARHSTVSDKSRLSVVYPASGCGL